MLIQPINSIECALLHNRFSPVPSEQVAEIVSRLGLQIGLNGECKTVSSNGGTSVFAFGDYRISIIQKDEPLPKKGFGGCLPQPITMLMMPDAEQIVDKHIANSFVSISRLTPSLDASQRLDDAEANQCDFRTSDDSLKAMKLGYLLVDGLHRNNQATAIHWLPSDHLVSGHMFELMTAGASLTPFFVRPYLYSSAGSIGNGNPVGVVANGSQYMLSKPVIFDEAVVDYKWLIERSTQFIDQAIRKNAVPEHGANFCVEDDEVIEVMHKDPDAANPYGSYTLIPRRVPKFGIEGGLHGILKSSPEDDATKANLDKKLDENDPIDFAIMQALKEREAAASQATRLPEVKDRRMGPRRTHDAAAFGRRGTFGKA